jgi:hypothetical protein
MSMGNEKYLRLKRVEDQARVMVMKFKVGLCDLLTVLSYSNMQESLFAIIEELESKNGQKLTFDQAMQRLRRPESSSLHITPLFIDSMNDQTIVIKPLDGLNKDMEILGCLLIGNVDYHLELFDETEHMVWEEVRLWHNSHE